MRESNLAANASVDALLRLADRGYLRFYSGRQPRGADMPLTDQILLAELRFSAPAFGPAMAGSASSLPIEPDVSARAEGEVTWFRALMSDGKTVLFDGSVGTHDTDLVLNQTSIVVGMNVSLDILTFTHPK